MSGDLCFNLEVCEKCLAMRATAIKAAAEAEQQHSCDSCRTKPYCNVETPKLPCPYWQQAEQQARQGQENRLLTKAERDGCIEMSLRLETRSEDELRRYICLDQDTKTARLVRAETLREMVVPIDKWALQQRCTENFPTDWQALATICNALSAGHMPGESDG